jgi:hypothetical protein
MKIRYPPALYVEVGCRQIWQVLLTLPRQKYHVMYHPPPTQSLNCSTLQQIQAKISSNFYFIIMCHIYR